MPRKDKGFARLKHENIEMNTFHGNESDDDDDMRVIGRSSDCSYCGTSEGTRSRWNVVMTITVLGLLCSTAVLFMYFAYRDSQMTGRLNELEDQVRELMASSSSTDASQQSDTNLAAEVDALAKKLNETASTLSHSLGEVNTSCYDIVNSQSEFVSSKAKLLDTAVKQIGKTQLNVNKTMELLATVRATVDGYIQTKADLDKSMGDLKQTVEKSQQNMERMSINMASHQAELKNLEGKVDNYTEQLTNTSLYCHRHVDQLHSLLTNMNASMVTEMSIMWRKMSLINETPGNVTVSKPVDTIGHLLDDPVFVHNISLKVTAMINGSLSHGVESEVESAVVLQLADNFTALQKWVWLLGEGLQQINHTLQSVKANVSEQCCVIGNATAVPSVTPTAVAVTPVNKSSSPSTDAGPSAVGNVTSSTSASLNGSQALQPATTTNTVSNSLVTTTIKANLPTTNTTSMVETSSSTITAMVLLPSPTHSETVVGKSNISSPTVLSTGEIPVLSSTVNIVVSSPVVIENKTATLQRGINALDEFLQSFDKMDVNKDDKLSYNETKLNKATFNKIATDGYITIDDIKRTKAMLEEEISALLETSTTANSHIVTSSSEVHSVTTVIIVTTSSQPVISSPQAARISSSDLAPSTPSSLVVISSSPAPATILLSSLKPSPSSTGSNLDDLGEELSDALEDSG